MTPPTDDSGPPTETLPPLDSRFVGMPDSMQGGYIASLAAGFGREAVRVRIRRPLRPGDQLTREHHDGICRVFRDGELVLEGRQTDLHVNEAAVEPLDRDQVLAASEQPPAFDLPFPTCAGCGEQDDSLGFSIRPYGDGRHTVGVWTPAGEPDAVAGAPVPRSHVWTINDCLTSWCVFIDPPSTGTGGAVTGNIAMQFFDELQVGATYVCQSWRVEDNERRIVCGGAIHNLDGDLIALADQELVRTDGWGMEIPQAPLA